MHHGCHGYDVRVDDIEDSIWEPAHENPARLPASDGVRRWTPFDALEDKRHLSQELASEPWALLLVPRECLGEICASLVLKQQARLHQPRRRSISSRTSRQGRPRLGSARCNASRRSRSLAWAGVKGMSAGVRLSHSSSTSCRRSLGLSWEISMRVVPTI